MLYVCFIHLYIFAISKKEKGKKNKDRKEQHQHFDDREKCYHNISYALTYYQKQ